MDYSEAVNLATHAFAAPGFNNLIDVVNPATGRTLLHGHTLEQVQAEYPGAELVEIESWLDEKAKRQQSPVEWSPVSEADYWEALEVLPPAYFGRGGFLMGEPTDHCAATGKPRFAAYRHAADGHEVASRPMTVAEFKELQG